MMDSGDDRRAWRRLFPVVFAGLILAGCQSMLPQNGPFGNFTRANQQVDTSPVSEQGIGKLAKGELLAAQALFDRALQQNPRDVHALLGKGLVFQQTGQLVQARAAFEAVLALRPGDAQKMLVLSNPAPHSVREIASVNLGLLHNRGVPSSLTGATPPAQVAPQIGAQPGAAPRPSFGTPPPLAQSPQAATQIGAAGAARGGPVLGPFTGPFTNVVSRFQTLENLRGQGLITPDEYNQRRALNKGALLPLTGPAPATGLDRSVPSTEQIAQRLRAIRRALELRAITVRQHGAERLMIVDGLMPLKPRQRLNPAPPPKGLMEAADAVRRIEALQEMKLVTSDEYTKERAAIENSLHPAGSTPAPAQAAGTAPATASASSGPQPALHIGSWRSEQGAKRAWTQLRRVYRSVFAKMRPEVSRVNLGRGKGVFFRLIVGPFATQAAAQKACRQLKRRRQYCEPAFMSGGA
jgi:tetratricopeptide (TPR) repeat protein